MTETGRTDFLPPDVDPDKPLLGVREVRGTNAAEPKTVSKVRDFTIVTDEKTGTNIGPSPLETVLCALTGCEGVIINRCARAMNFKYSGVDFECDGWVDARGSRGVRGVRPHFQKVSFKVLLKTDEPESRIEKLRKNVEMRCPVMNLLADAGVELDVSWVRIDP
ncbi:MAG TPA: OsmC family protein [Alphaproteobacteria bacterium]|nr:OsmC family protein [Alphaproteobacteria bacterium]